MFATRIITATLALSSMLVAQAPGLDEAFPTVSAVRLGPQRGATIDIFVEQPGGLSGIPVSQTRRRPGQPGPAQAASQTTSPSGGQTFVEYSDLGPATEADIDAPTGRTPPTAHRRQLVEDSEPIQFAQQSSGPAFGMAGGAGGAGGQVHFEKTGSENFGIEEGKDQPLALSPGVSLTRCGVTISNDAASSSAVMLSPAGPGCFTGILIADGVHAGIEVSAEATGLEALQVTVMGRAFLDVSGERGLGHYDPRDFASTQAGILVDGDGLTASDQEDMATITLKSSHNVVETLGASRDHVIHVMGSSNLIRLHGEDQVLTDGKDVRVMWQPPIFLL